MAHDIQLPIDGENLCMRCKTHPPPELRLLCNTCVTPWHFSCLLDSSRPETLSSTLKWDCPDCSGDTTAAPVAGGGEESSLVARIREIENDKSLSEKEKAKKRQELLGGKVDEDDDEEKGKGKVTGGGDVLDVLDVSFKCSFCMLLPDRPVTTPCGHNFCLKCFQKWIAQGKRTCAKCRSDIPAKMASQPRINSTLVAAIRMAKISKTIGAGGPAKIYHFVHNQNRPDKAYTTERAQKAGKANACSGKIFVTVPPDHFGPIPAENDPERNQGVLVGEYWEDRLECRQWGAHLPHVAGIAGQSSYGAQSVALSGGYIDDEDHGEWFLYTGSGGRDLSNNKRTNKEQSSDQKFEKMNEALRVSCRKGYPVRVVRSHKEKRSSYAPEKGVRYDGVYRIEKCWRKVGIQGFKVCRYLFVRCDNEPAPWTSDEHGDRPRSLPNIPELNKATELFERKESPSWDFDEEAGQWKWKKPPPPSKKPVDAGNPEDTKRARKAIRQARTTSIKERLLKEFSCMICKQVMTQPMTTPCAHNFCKSCLEGAFAGKALVRERNRGGRSLRTQKNVLQCPRCPTDISDFLKDPQVNRELMAVIESLQSKSEENGDSVEDDEENEVNVGEEGADDSKEKPSSLEEKTEGEENISEDPAGEEKVPANDSEELGGEEVQQPEANGSEEVDTEKEVEAPASEQARPSKRPYKRKDRSSGAETTENVAEPEKKTRGRKARNVAADGNDSPSSPLHVRSSSDDNE